MNPIATHPSKYSKSERMIEEVANAMATLIPTPTMIPHAIPTLSISRLPQRSARGTKKLRKYPVQPAPSATLATGKKNHETTASTVRVVSFVHCGSPFLSSANISCSKYMMPTVPTIAPNIGATPPSTHRSRSPSLTSAATCARECLIRR